MDRRTLVAVALCVALFFAYPYILKMFGLDRYLHPTPPATPPATVDTTRTATPSGALPERIATATSPTPAPAPATAIAAVPFKPAHAELERLIDVETPLYRAEFSTRGARLVSVELKHYASAHGASATAHGIAPHPKHGEPLDPADRVVLAGGPTFALDLGSGATTRSLDNVVYAASESLDAAGQPRAVTFTTADGNGLSLRQTYRVRPDDYTLDLEVEIRGVPLEWRLSDYSLTTRSWPLLNEATTADEVRSLRGSCLVGTNLHHELTPSLKRGPKVYEGNTRWAAVQTRYFSSAIAVTQGSGKSAVVHGEVRHLDAARLRTLPPGIAADQEVAVSSLVVGLPGASSPVHRFLVYVGPNDFQRLDRLGNDLGRLVDLGWTWIRPFSKALLQLLVWLHAVIPNYGICIIVLATLVRVLLHPLNMMSMKSMRAMQRLQPEIERLKDKYKNDAQALNTAIMALYKDNKVNPAGGCLPMLMQMPLFIALYSVLFNAIELRQAPFMWWVHDLSAPDALFWVGPFPFRLLPILMTGSGLLSQRLTPVDPRQSSSMYMMNVIMLVFFYNLPSGLVLYWTVMNLLTALQQWMVLHEDTRKGIAPARVGGPAVAKKATAK